MAKRKRKYQTHEFLTSAAHVTKLKPRRQELPSVDPEKLPDDALDRRARYREEVEAREAKAAAFVPWNQRGAKRDEEGRLVAIDDRDRKPPWLA